MIEIFDIGIKILIAATSIFFLVLFYFARAWSASHPENSTRIGVMVGVLYSFMFFLAGLLIVSLISLSWDGLMSLVDFLRNSLMSLIKFS